MASERLRVTPIRAACALLALSSAVPTYTAAPQRPSLDDLVARATDYVQDFVNRFSNVVAEERYVQAVKYTTIGLEPRIPTAHRELRSDFLLVKTLPSNDWLTFRDVFEVDGKAIRDREERRVTLFLESGGSALERATQIATESARYNLVGSARTINDPLLALALLQARYQARFRYTLRNIDKDVGPDVWAVDFEERERPSIIQGRLGHDLVARGRVWIDRETGRVVKTDLSVTSLDHVITSFRFDETFGIAVPVKMEEQYAVNVADRGSGTATYGRFRRFEVRTEEQIQKPQ